MFETVLVANRGEIAVRVIRGLRDRGIRSVAVYSDADRGSLHVRMADEAAWVGPAPSSESYLRSDRILEAAKKHGAQAIHPGYGFLSENADFAQACKDEGIKFIGPPPDAIRAMGSKTAARKVAERAGAPVVPGTSEPLSGIEEARATASRIGYPVMLKAAAGGGGKGMRRVDSEPQLESALRDAASEAERSFKNSEVYVEKMIQRPRHIEVQVLGDEHGHVIHLGERECSLQRRHQKVVEECPSPLVASRPGMRNEMGAAAVKVAKAAGYANAGTIEFLADDSGQFYFLEMNTRLQVEHPVTELVTGLDLVDWQLRIACGERLTVRQEDVEWRGWAMECRLYAEDPDTNFLPSPGLIEHLSLPSGPGIRLDNGVYQGWRVPMEYDPLLAKLATWGVTREVAVDRMLRALKETAVSGIRTNIGFFLGILDDPAFRDGRIHTAFIDDFLVRRNASPSETDPELHQAVALAAFLHSKKSKPDPVSANGPSKWTAEGRRSTLR